MLACSDNICNTFSALHLNFLSTLVTPNCERENICRRPLPLLLWVDSFTQGEFIKGEKIGTTTRERREGGSRELTLDLDYITVE
ncbi:hypothetical protein OUZ56_030952 [Daphnia magna]|uniref:Uncharacterized protein n=1 Tax=Daphnia magna TaxID=35525 RepID=A0ABQ9ZST6_9CRUS|nr:hypothetical protein OUZ56_030952 [Daphnia magna]